MGAASMGRHLVDWHGYIPAITTPFKESGDLDTAALEKLLQWMLQEKMHGIIIAGTQGEWFSLLPAEREKLFRIAGRQLGGRMPLIAGCNAFTAAEVLANARMAADCGFDGILVTPPPYVVPDRTEILRFYRDVSEGTRLPMCIYNWPPGTNVDMSLDLLRELTELPNVVAIKNSTADLRRFLEVFFALKDRVRIFGVPMNELGITLVRHHGADGTMGAGGVLGRELPDYFNAIWAGDLSRAQHFGARNELLMRSWFHDDYRGRFGSAQAIFKEALNQLGLPGGYPRRPLLPLNADGVNAVREALVRLGMK